jgi:hypothetical protein
MLVTNQDSNLPECLRLDPAIGCPVTRTGCVSISVAASTGMCVKRSIRIVSSA